MGNYFRQIYTSIHGEWRTTAVDPCRRGSAAEGFSAAVGQLRKSHRSVEKKRGRSAGGAKGWVINSRSSSGSVSIVGVMGQMSAALMALPDAWLAPCGRP